MKGKEKMESNKMKAWKEFCESLLKLGMVLIQESPAMEAEAPVEVETKPEPAKKSKAKKEKVKEPEPEPELSDEDLDLLLDDNDSDETEVEITPLDLRTALVDYAKEYGKDAAYGVLAKFKAKKVDDLKASDYPKVMEALQG